MKASVKLDYVNCMFFHKGMRRAGMSPAGATSGVFVLLLAATVVHGQNGWRVYYTLLQKCALKGSDVEIDCSYTHPYEMDDKRLKVKEEFWFINENNGRYRNLKNDSNYSNRVTYSCANKSCKLTIKNLRETDSAEYKFRFTTNNYYGKYTGQPGVHLHVTDLKVQARIAVTGGHNSVWLECQSSCDLPQYSTYTWYNNGQKVWRQTSKYYLISLNQRSNIKCCVNGYKSCSPSLSPNVNWGVIPTTKICTVRGSTVKIECKYSPTNTRETNSKDSTIFCFTTLEDGKRVGVKRYSDFRDRVTYYCGTDYCTMSISDLRDSDSADYKFRFPSNHGNQAYSSGVTLSFTDPQLQINVKKYSEGVNLTCHSNCQLPGGVSYIWYNDGQKCKEEKQYFFVNTFPAVRKYQCAVKGHDQIRSSAVYAPMSPSVLMSPTGEIMEGTPVNLTCSSDANPAAKYAWYKNGSSGYQLVGENQSLVFNSTQSSDFGQYYCSAENDLGENITSIFIDVKYSPKPPSVSVSPSGPIVEGISVTLTCKSDANPAAEYTWYKENQNEPCRREGVHTFRSISSGDRGTYFCKAENKFGIVKSSSLIVEVLYAPRLPFLSVSPSGEIIEGNSVTLTCRSEANPAANYTWYKKYKGFKKYSGQKLIINNTKLEDSGHFYCEAENGMGSNNSTIHLTVVAAFSQGLKITIGIATVFFLTMILLFFFLLLRKKRPTVPSLVPSLVSSPGHGHEERPGSSEECQTSHLENQEDLHYASVRFMTNKSDAIYVNIKQATAFRPKKKEEDDNVEYASVRFAHPGQRMASQPEEDPNALYSLVKKT